MGDGTEFQRKADSAVRRAIESSGVKDQPKSKNWIQENIKAIGAVATLLLATNGGQLLGVTLPSVQKAEIKTSEKIAMQDALVMTGQAWMSEIATARKEEKDDCREQKTELNDHWQARMDNHIHPEIP